MEKEPQTGRPRAGQSHNVADSPGAAGGRNAPGGREMARIAKWLKQVRFRRALLGVSEKDVWKKIGELNDMYKLAIIAERARYDALIEEQRLRLTDGLEDAGEDRR